jgi:hypothetical protein
MIEKYDINELTKPEVDFLKRLDELYRIHTLVENEKTWNDIHEALDHLPPNLDIDMGLEIDTEEQILYRHINIFWEELTIRFYMIERTLPYGYLD